MNTSTVADAGGRSAAVLQQERRDGADTLARLRRCFDDDLAGHAIATPDGCMLACNAEFARIAGYASIEEALAANLRMLEAEPGAFVSLLERLQQSPLIPLEELCFVRRDGTRAHVLARLAATLDAAGAITEVCVYFVDITRHVLLEQRLRESADRLALLELATHDVHWDWDLASGQRTWNGAVAQRFRYTAEEVRSTIDWHIDRIHPADRERVLRSIERATVGVESRWSDEYRFLRGDGTYANVLDRAHIVRNGRGEPIRMIGVIIDITELKASEESQRIVARASAAFESAFEVEPIATTLARVGVPDLADLCLVDLLAREGALRRVAAAHAEPHRETLLGLGTRFTDDPEVTTGPLHVVRTATPEVRAVVDEAALRSLGLADGVGVRGYVTIPIEARHRILGAATFGFTDARRRLSLLELKSIKDLTELAGLTLDNAMLYGTAQLALRTRNEVLGVVSHDLRLPVNTMIATLSLLNDSVHERRGEIREWFDILLRATTQMRTLVEDLLDASRMESQQFSVSRSAGAVATIINEACAMLRPIADAKDITIETDFGDELPLVSVDGPKLVRVIGNLLGNAIKFSPRGTAIRVVAQRWADELRVSVSDQGEGIPADRLERVFDRFWSGRTGDRRGAGLGLTIAKGIVEAHGGRIWVDSHEHAGSTFTFAVPLDGAAANVPQPPT